MVLKKVAGGSLMKIKLRYIGILLIVIVTVASLIIYRCFWYYPDIEIKISNLYNIPSNIVQFNGKYYKVKDGDIYNLDSGEVLFQTTNKCMFAKTVDNLLWVVDNSDKDNLKAIDSSGKAVKSYSIPDYTKDFFINNNVIFCMSSDGIEIYQLYNDGHKEQISVDYSFVFESENSYFKLYKYSCEYGECLYFDMESDNYNDSYFAVDSNMQNMISSNGRVNLLHYQQDRIIYTESSFRLKTLYEYSFVDGEEHCCNNIDIDDYAQGFFENTPYVSNDKYIISVAQRTTSRSITRDGGPTATSCEMSKHENDVIYIISTDDCTKSFLHKTKTFERILYADNKRAITYYDGEYLTYSLEKWNVIDTQSADEIQIGGSYTFESCGDYIFVFDDNSGELLNTINVA